jgi:hypothetical protein
MRSARWRGACRSGGGVGGSEGCPWVFFSSFRLSLWDSLFSFSVCLGRPSGGVAWLATLSMDTVHHRIRPKDEARQLASCCLADAHFVLRSFSLPAHSAWYFGSLGLGVHVLRFLSLRAYSAWPGRLMTPFPFHTTFFQRKLGGLAHVPPLAGRRGISHCFLWRLPAILQRHGG